MFDLKTLGLSERELQDRVIAHIADLILSSKSYDEDGDPVENASKFKQQIVALVQKRINEKLADVAEKYVLPKVSEFIEDLKLTATNQWGEKTGKTKTFIEYLTERAEAYLREPVNRDGKTQEECRARCDTFTAEAPRLTRLVNDHLAREIKISMDEAVKTAHGGLSKALAETAAIQLGKIAQSLKVAVTT